MVSINVRQTKEDCLIEIHGHAKYAPIGSDIVCSAISCLFATLINCIEETSDALCRYNDIGKDDKTLYIANLDAPGDYAIEFFRIGCKGVQEAYEQYVSFKDM